MDDTLRVRVNDRWYTVEAVDIDAEPAVVLVDGERVEVSLDQPLIRAGDPVAAAHRVAEQPAAYAPAPAAAPSAGGRAFTSPMPGIVLSVAVGSRRPGHHRRRHMRLGGDEDAADAEGRLVRAS